MAQSVSDQWVISDKVTYWAVCGQLIIIPRIIHNFGKDFTNVNFSKIKESQGKMLYEL